MKNNTWDLNITCLCTSPVTTINHADHLYGNLVLIIFTFTDTGKDLEFQPQYKLKELKDVSQFEHGILGVL